MIYFLALLALAPRYTVSSEPAAFRNDRSLPDLGSKFAADENPHSTFALGLRSVALSLTESERYKVMFPKVQLVAMMFLIRDKVHTESVWREWLLPLSNLVHPDIECNAQVKKCYKETLILQPARGVYDEQGFFSFYVHPKPGAPASRNGSIFYEGEVKDRVEVRHSTLVTLRYYGVLKAVKIQSQTSHR